MIKKKSVQICVLVPPFVALWPRSSILLIEKLNHSKNHLLNTMSPLAMKHQNPSSQLVSRSWKLQSANLVVVAGEGGDGRPGRGYSGPQTPPSCQGLTTRSHSSRHPVC